MQRIRDGRNAEENAVLTRYGLYEVWVMKMASQSRR
jgi:hypothetical protein